MANYDESIWQRTGNFLYNNRTWILGVLVFIFFICTISLAARKSEVPCPDKPAPVTPVIEANCSQTDELRNCFPDNLLSVTKTQEECHKRGCCWDETSKKCSFGVNHQGYSIKLTELNENGLRARLSRLTPSGFKDDIKDVDLVIEYVSNEVVRIKFTDSNDDERWQVKLPQELNIPTVKDGQQQLYLIELNEEGILRIKRRSNLKVLMETDLKTLIYSNLFHQIEFNTINNKIIGLSEHKENDFVKLMNESEKKYTIWNRGEQPSQGINNLYSCHPFYLMMDADDSDNSHGVFLHNSNGMDIVTHNKPSVTWRVTGGILDFFVFLGPEPLSVSKQYINLIGLPSLVPYWSLGFHIARYGYDTGDELKKVIKRNQDIGIPYDVQWTDIDALEDYHNIFTYNKQNFSELPKIVEELHAKHMKYIPMADPSISDTDENGKVQYDLGKSFNIYIKSADGVKDLQVKVWNKETSVWVDFTHPNATTVWHTMAEGLNKETPFDGLWIDMNEPYNMNDPICTNDISPQYVPGIENGLLSNHTACLYSKQHLGNHYDVHNLYGLYEAKVTFDTLKQLGKRPFVLSRSTAFSSGRYTAHWSGDIDSSWDHLRWTITSIMEFNLYGIPMIGADICGFQKYNVTDDLCARWMQLGAFYPFSRNHNDFYLYLDGTPKRDNDPGNWDKDSFVVKGSIKALNLRYRLMPTLYTIMAFNSMHGLPAVRSLWFNYPTDSKTIHIHDQFMWGDSIMVIPIVEEEKDASGNEVTKTKRDAYLPKGNWFDIQNNFNKLQGSTTQHLDIDKESIMVLVKEGSIITTQEPKVTTFETRTGPFIVYIILDESSEKADGHLYWDSGDSIDPIEEKSYSLLTFAVDNNKLTATKEPGTKFNDEMKLGTLVVVGAEDGFTKVTVDGQETTQVKPKYDSSSKSMTLEGFNLDINKLTTDKPLVIEWVK